MSNNTYNTSVYSSPKNLLKRLETGMLTCHRPMEVFRIVFKNLEGSWVAIHLAHKIVKEEVEEE
ncbi:MAG: hypothetical protein H0X26_09665 [Alphaproteobacteria bacterium]|nr:hypothetical protein [Alphaproteobacteria bacterium]